MKKTLRNRCMYTFSKHLLILCSLFIVSSPSSVFTAEKADEEMKTTRVFRAGAAMSNITPPLGEPIVGGWSPIPAKHVHDELYARCLVLDDGETQVAFAVCDNVGIAQAVFDEAKRIAHERTGIPMENMMMSATHTHSSISASGSNRMVRQEDFTPYQLFLINRIADGIQRAANHLEPARIGWGSGEEPTSVFNRRWFMKADFPLPNPFGGVDKVRMNPGRGSADLIEPAGPTDPEVSFLSVQSKEGRPIGLLANYSLHYVGPGVSNAISADYFGVFSDRIQQLFQADRLDPPFVGIMSNGTSGDVNNINFYTKSDQTWKPYEKMKDVAYRVAQVVYDAHEKIDHHDWVQLNAEQVEIPLQVRKPTQEQLAYARAIQEKPDQEKPYHQHEKIYAQRIFNLSEAPDAITIALQAFRIGDLCICAIPFEVFVEIGLEIKEKSPFENTFTLSLANGSYGYLPTLKHHALGGYETWQGTNTVEKEASSKIVSTFEDIFKKLHEE